MTSLSLILAITHEFALGDTGAEIRTTECRGHPCSSSGGAIPAFAADSITAARKIPCAIVDSSLAARAAYTFILASCADLSSGAAATAQSAR
jgi:hypothetical protein